MANIQQLFDHIAPQYERFNHISSLNIDRYWRRMAVKKLDKTKFVLDVAIGTADLAIEIIHQQKAEHVEGIDLSVKMMEIGQQKVRQAGMENAITFREGSALQLPYPDNSFDAVTCAYGVRNFTHLDQGLSEMLRVLRPGGQLMILEFSHPTNAFIERCWNIYFKNVLTRIGGTLTHNKEAFEYFYQSVKKFIFGNEMCRKLAQIGFQSPIYHPLTWNISTIYIAKK